MSENSQSIHSQHIKKKKTYTSLKNLIGIAVCKKMTLNMLKHSIVHNTTKGLNSVDSSKIKKAIKKLGIIKYVDEVYNTKSYLPIIGKEHIKEFILSQKFPLKSSFRKKV